MSNTPNLDIEYLEPNSDQPEVPVNAAILALEEKITDNVAVLIGNTGIATLTKAEQALGSIFTLSAGSPAPAAPVTVNFAAYGMGLFAVVNSSGFPATLTYAGQPLTAPTLDSGSVGLFCGDGINIRTVVSGGAGSGGIVAAIQASETLVAGNMVNVWNSGGARIRKANATDDTKPAHGFVLAAVTSGNVGIFYGAGQINNQRSGMTPGATYYLDTTGGAINATPPASAGNMVQELGVALSATQLAFAPKQTVLL